MKLQTQPKVQQFDVFSRAFKGEWKFSGCVEGRTSADAKHKFMYENQIANPNNVAVYQKR